MATDKSLKIISLQAENVKKLVAVRIDPRGNLVRITGKNGAGKTSVLDSIWWAIGGLGNVQKSPIRKGQEKARIRLDLGELVVTRTFTRAEGDEFTSTIAVESADGGRLTSPQKLLDSFYDALAFDPLEFARMKPKEQFDTLKAMVPGADLDKLDALNRADFAKRTEVNRLAKGKAAEAAAIAIPESVPAIKIDEAELVNEIATVGDHNAQLERRQEGRELVAKEAKDFRAAAANAREGAAEHRRQADFLDAQALTDDAEAEAREKKLASAEALPPPKDPAAVMRRLDEAKRTNALVDQAAKRAALVAGADAYEKQADELTARMAARDEEKRTAIAGAKLPVDGLGFGEDHITLGGVPFNQASSAEQLRTSLAIAMAANPRLRVIRVRDGSLLDEDGLRLVAEMADARDYQVWVESVDSSGKVGFVLEDGQVRHVPEAPAEAEAKLAAAE